MSAVSRSTALIFYHSNIVSLLRYGLPLWGKCSRADSVFIEQKKIIRILFNKPINYHCRDLFISNNLFTLPSLYIFECLKYAVNNGILSPTNLAPGHRYNTRHHSICNIPTSLVSTEANVTYSSIQLFNALPLDIKNSLRSHDVHAFLRQIKRLMLQKAYYDISEFFST